MTASGSAPAGRLHALTAFPARTSVAPALEEWLSPDRERKLLMGILILGVAARALRYLLRFPLWDDECFLGVNFLDRGYLALLEPLDYHQVAPPLFLWIELSMVRLLGFGELSLRLFPFLASVASLFLFCRLSGHFCTKSARLFSVAMLSAAYPGIRYAAEAKQYGSDLFVSLVILVLFAEWWRQPREWRWLVTLAAWMPLAVGLSYPSLFVAGAVSVLAGAILVANGSRANWLAWVAFNASLGASALVVFWLAARHQSAAELEFMRTFWHYAMPPLDSTSAFLAWLVGVHTGDLLGYPVGGPRGASTVSFLLWVTGIVYFWRKRAWMLLALCLAPLGLNFLAALLARYPYGGHVKFSQYLAPLLCLALGAGAAVFSAWLARREASNLRPVCVGLALVGLVAVGTMARDLARPFKSPTDARFRDFARWFWFNMPYEGEVVCLKTDLHRDFSPRTWKELGWSAMYLCNQRIYSPRHSRRQDPDLNRVSADAPLRCVQYRAPNFEFQRAEFDAWLEDMLAQYDLVATDRYPVPCLNKSDRVLLSMDYLEVYKFAPKGVAGRSALPGDVLRK